MHMYTTIYYGSGKNEKGRHEMTTGNSEENIIPFEIPVGMADGGCQDDPERTRALGSRTLRYRVQKAMAILMNFNDIIDAVESGEEDDPEILVVMDLMMSEIESGLRIGQSEEGPDE